MITNLLKKRFRLVWVSQFCEILRSHRPPIKGILKEPWKTLNLNQSYRISHSTLSALILGGFMGSIR